MKIFTYSLMLIVCACAPVAGKSVWELMSERPVFSPAPILPEEARLKHLSGSGIFTLYLWTDGRVRHVTITKSTGHAILDKAAIDTLSKWRYGPRSASTVAVPITFAKK